MGYNTDILDEANVSAYGKLIYFVLSKYAGRDGTCWPAIKTIADAAGVSRPTVIKAIKELKEIGYLEIHRRVSGENGADISNLYYLPRLTRVNEIDTGVSDIATPCKGDLLPRVNDVDTNLSNITYPLNYNSDEQKILDYLPTISQYPFELKKDVAQVREWLKNYPAQHVLVELEKFNAWWRDKESSFKGKKNFRSSITNWLKKTKVEPPQSKGNWLVDLDGEF